MCLHCFIDLNDSVASLIIDCILQQKSHFRFSFAPDTSCSGKCKTILTSLILGLRFVTTSYISHRVDRAERGVGACDV
jgi:hypothetical protein